MTRTSDRWVSISAALLLAAATALAGCGGEYVEEDEELLESSTEEVTAGYFNSYTTVANLGNANGCYATQAFGVGSTYAYSVKVNSENTKAVIYRTDMSTGVTTLMTNGNNGTTYATYLGHANDMVLADINGVHHMFVVTLSTGSLSLVKLRYSGTTYYKAGSYTIRYNGADKAMSGVKITSKDASYIRFLFKSGRTLYRGSLPLTANSGTINVTYAFTLNTEAAKVNGSTISNIASYVSQGMGYKNNTLYVPLTYQNISVVLVYRNISAAAGTIYADNSVSFRITSSAYPDSFEIESLGVDGAGKLWFNCNRRTTPSDMAHDAVAYFKNYTAF